MHRRHRAFYIAAGIGLAAAGVTAALRPAFAVEAGANSFFAAYLVLVFRLLPEMTPAWLAKHASEADEPAWAIFAATLIAVGVAVVSLFTLVNDPASLTMPRLFFALSSVALGWNAIHTMAAMHYAHAFWRHKPPAADGEANRGLDFPKTTQPSGVDFVYFAFVIGMTAQTSDVAVTTTKMRKLVAAHGVVSFFFNTVLVAAAVNVAVSLGNN